MKQLICRTCGSPLDLKGDHYQCRYCDSIYVEEEANRFQEELENALEDYKIESLAKARRSLYDATHRRYPSESSVVSAATAVLSISPEDFLASIYLHSYDRDPGELNAILASARVSAPEAEKANSWLLPNLHPRSIGPLKAFLERNLSDEALTKALASLEKEAEKADEGIYDPSFPRDVFLCYSSADMDKVVATMELLEENGFLCFAAFRNLRTGRGAVERYNEEIFKAMKACKCLLFLSSVASRSPACDAVRIELPYLNSDLGSKPRVEYLLEDYSKRNVPLLAMRVIKEAFDGLQWVRGEEELIDRLLSLTSPKRSKEEPKRNPEPEPKAPPKEETYDYSCPTCGKGIPYLTNPCPHCGQSLDWGQREEQEETPMNDLSFGNGQSYGSTVSSSSGGLSIKVSTISGDVEIKNGKSLSIVGGHYSQSGNSLTVRTTSDDVVISLPPGAQGSLSIISGSGDVDITADKSSFEDISVQSTSGDVYLAVPNFDSFRCTTASGDLTTKKNYPNVFFSSISGERC